MPGSFLPCLSISRAWIALRSWRLASVICLTWVALNSLPMAASPSSGTLPADVLKANQELDQKFLDAHPRRDTGMIMDLFSTGPDVFLIAPAGELYQGRDQIRQSIQKFFDRIVTMTGTIDHVKYLPAGDGVIAVGQVTYQRQLNGKAPDKSVVVWTDYRRKENGKWVLVFRHAHWPLNALPAASAKPKTAAR